MTITQTVEIPADRRLFVEVPKEVPAGKVILTFTPAGDTAIAENECPICAKHRDPVTGNPRYNAETVAAMQEARDIAAGKIPGSWHRTLDEAREELGF